jgi:amino acid permease
MSILSLPFSFHQSGIALGLVLLLVFAVLASFTAKLLRDCIEHIKEQREVNDDLETESLIPRSPTLPIITYADVGLEAFGPYGSAFVQIVFSLELFACNTAFVVITADCIVGLGADLSPLLLKAIFIGILCPFTVAGNMKLFSSISIVGILAVLGVCLIIIGRGATPAPPSWIVPAESVRWLPYSISSLSSAIGIMVVGFDAHSVFPSVF